MAFSSGLRIFNKHGNNESRNNLLIIKVVISISVTIIGFITATSNKLFSNAHLSFMPFLFPFYEVFRALGEDRLRSHKTGMFGKYNTLPLPTGCCQSHSFSSASSEEEAPPRNMVVKVLRLLNEPPRQSQ